MSETTEDYLVRNFRYFAEMCDRESPLYAHLSAHIADDVDMLAIAAHSQMRQPPPNMLLGAVHYLLLGGMRHELAEYYPSVGGDRPAHETWPVFREFCITHQDEIVPIVASRRVQTNEVGRCGMLAPAFALAYHTFGKPIYLIELGASAGLNLQCDTYRYEYSNGSVVGDDSSVTLHVELRGEFDLQLPSRFPPVAKRIGVDLSPVDVTDANAMRWVQALIWPEQLDRHELHRAAMSFAVADPPEIVAGDGLEVIPELVRSSDNDVLPMVFHTHATYQMDHAWHSSFSEALDAVGRLRDMAYVALEAVKNDPAPKLDMTSWRDGESQHLFFAECHHHGRWIQPKQDVLLRDSA